MKVILIDEVLGLGDRGDVVQVRDGYARNFLLPKKLALQANAANMKAAEHEKKKWEALSLQEKSAASEVAEKLSGTRLTIHKRVGESGTLFGSVTSAEIAEALKAQTQIELDKRKIELEHPIKEVGTHQVSVRLHREVTAQVEVEVLPQSEGQA
jgi:large subunit ribosomal protein L9